MSLILFFLSVPKVFQLSSTMTIVHCYEGLHPLPQSQSQSHSQPQGPRAIIRRWAWGVDGFGEIEVALVLFQKSPESSCVLPITGGKIRSVDQENPHQTVSANTLITLDLLTHEMKKISAEPGMGYIP